MPPLPPAPSVLKLAHVFSLGEPAPCRAHLYVHYSGGPPSDPDCVAISTNLAVAGASEFPTLLSTDYSFLGVEVTDLSSPAGSFGFHGIVAAGVLGGPPAGGQTCAVLNQTIGRRYRGGKPKSFWPFGSAGDILNATSWAVAFLTTLAANFATYETAVLLAGAGTTVIDRFVALSYFTGPNVVTISPTTGRARNTSTRRVAPLIDTVQTQHFSSTLGSQRRRRNL